MLFVLYKVLMMDQLNPKQKPKPMKVNISCAWTEDVLFYLWMAVERRCQ